MERVASMNKGILPMGRHDKSSPPSVGHGPRFAVAYGHPTGPTMCSLKKTSYWSSVRLALNRLVFGERRTNKQTNEQNGIAIASSHRLR